MRQLTETEMETLRQEGLLLDGTICMGHDTKFGIMNKIENVSIDNYSYTGEFCILQNTTIGKMCSIAAMVRIGATDHPIERAIQHTLTYRAQNYGIGEKDESFLTYRTTKITEIGHDVWIGHGVIIKVGVKIGNGAVIGSGTIVTKDVPDYAIVAKQPQTILRYRFTPQTIALLQKIQPWELTKEELTEGMPFLQTNADDFIEWWERKNAN